MALNKAKLIRKMQERNTDTPEDKVENVVEIILHELKEGLIQGHSAEIRGFASFKVNHYQPRVGRNPKTGESVNIDHRFKPVCHAGKMLRARIDKGNA